MKSILTPPANVLVKENASSIYWFDADGIVCSIIKDVPPQTVEQNQQILNEFKELTKGRKFCMLLDVTHAKANNKEAREFAAIEFPKIVTAMAMVSRSPMGRMLVNIFFALKPAPYPAKMFATEKDAKEWLKQYLQN